MDTDEFEDAEIIKNEDLNEDAEYTGNKQDLEKILLDAQRYLNIFHQIHIFNDRKKEEFNQSLIDMPERVRAVLLSLPGGRVLIEYIEDYEIRRGLRTTRSIFNSDDPFLRYEQRKEQNISDGKDITKAIANTLETYNKGLLQVNEKILQNTLQVSSNNGQQVDQTMVLANALQENNRQQMEMMKNFGSMLSQAILTSQKEMLESITQNAGTFTQNSVDIKKNPTGTEQKQQQVKNTQKNQSDAKQNAQKSQENPNKTINQQQKSSSAAELKNATGSNKHDNTMQRENKNQQASVNTGVNAKKGTVDNTKQKNNIDISDIKTVNTPNIKTVNIPEIKTVNTPEIKTVNTPEIKTVNTPEIKTVNTPEIKTVNTPNIKTVNTPEIKTVNTPNIKTVNTPEIKTVNTPEIKTVNTPEIKTVNTPNIKTVNIPEIKTVNTPEIKTVNTPEPQSEDMKQREYVPSEVEIKTLLEDSKKDSFSDKSPDMASTSPLYGNAMQKIKDAITETTDISLDDIAPISLENDEDNLTASFSNAFTSLQTETSDEDNEEWEYVDEDGNPIDFDEWEYVDEDGNPVNLDEWEYVDEDGNPVEP